MTIFLVRNTYSRLQVNRWNKSVKLIFETIFLLLQKRKLKSLNSYSLLFKAHVSRFEIPYKILQISLWQSVLEFSLKVSLKMPRRSGNSCGRIKSEIGEVLDAFNGEISTTSHNKHQAFIVREFVENFRKASIQGSRIITYSREMRIWTETRAWYTNEINYQSIERHLDSGWGINSERSKRQGQRNCTWIVRGKITYGSQLNARLVWYIQSD